MPVFTSNDAAVPAVTGENTTSGIGVSGTSKSGYGVDAASTSVALHAKGLTAAVFEGNVNIGTLTPPQPQALTVEGTILFYTGKNLGFLNSGWTAQDDPPGAATIALQGAGSNTAIAIAPSGGPAVLTVLGSTTLEYAGKVGINDTNPGSTLTVQGNSVQSAGPGAGFQFLDRVSGSGFQWYSSGGTAYLYDQTATSNRLAINSSGNVGIGTTNPAAPLDVQGATSGAPQIRALNGTNAVLATYAHTSGYGAIEAYNNSGTKLALNLNPWGGNVGIGTTSPAATLEVNGNIQLDGNRLVTGIDGANNFWLKNNAGSEPSNNAFGYSTNGSGTVQSVTLATAGLPRLSIDSSGTVSVPGDILLTNADCAEEFDIAGAAEVEPGTVMVLDSRGALQPSRRAYDKKVAGVISGAGEFKPGLILDKKESSEGRMPIALLGKVYCKVDAQYGQVEVGDLLTTSSTAGHAMRAEDPLKAFGAIIGKALQSMSAGQRGLIPILVALQ